MTRVLYVNHTSKVSGAEHTLLDLLRGLPPEVEPVVTSPSGRLSEEVKALGVPHAPLRECELSLKLDPRGTPRALFQLLAAGREAGRVARSVGARFVHAFSVRAALGCGLGSDVRMVAHAHDALGRGPASRSVAEVLSRRSRLILAASGYVADRLPAGRGRAPVAVVDNPVDAEKFDPSDASGTLARMELGIPDDAYVLAVIAQITPWKGQDTAMRVLAGLRDRGLDAHLLVVGSPVFTETLTRHDNVAFRRSLEQLRNTLGLECRAHFLGERDDIPALLAATDLTLVPSWEEPFGRVVVESMAMKVPVLATSNGGPPSILSDGGGAALDPEDIERWVDTAERLLLNPGERARMGEKGAAVATGRFALDGWVERVLDAYGLVEAE